MGIGEKAVQLQKVMAIGESRKALRSHKEARNTWRRSASRKVTKRFDTYKKTGKWRNNT